MITHIRMKNFKSWQDSGEVKLAPLTGFFGTNSSGKSSLLQMLLLLKQTADRANIEEAIYFGDENSLINLGNYQEVIHDHVSEDTLFFEFGYQFNNPFAIRIQLLDSDVRGNFTKFQVDSLTFEVKISFNDNVASVQECCYYVKSGTEEHEVRRHSPGIVYGEPYWSGLTDNPIIQLTAEFKKLFTQVYYLGPIRSHPQRQYHWEGSHPIDLGRWGDKTIDALLSARVDRKTIPHDEGEVSIEKRISDWLREMNLAHTFWLERIEQQGGKDYDVRIQLNENGPKIALADMGYGLSHFLPVLVLCYYAPEGSTLILEQPGIHLHPMVQSQLADLLIEVVNERKLQILVESHSEHLLTRLQLRIAEQEIAADQTALYFCENENGTSKIKSLEIDDLGNITNWPKNFFGNVRGDLKKMARQQIERQKEAEG